MEETKCYCGHTIYCDCGPEEPKQERSYSEEEFKIMVYNMVEALAHANNMTFNGVILNELFNKFKNK